MIMEGLETLVAPSHHTFLLTESAAAAHFNVLSFDTCGLFKTGTTTTSLGLNNNSTTTPNNNHHHHLYHPYHHQTAVSTATALAHHQPHHHNHHQHHSTNQHQQQQQQQHQHNSSASTIVSSSAVSSAIASAASSTAITTHTTATTSVTAASHTSHGHSHHHPSHPHLSLLSTGGGGSGTGGATGHHSNDSSTLHSGTGDDHSQSQTDAQAGDLNTPVTTSGDIPSFFGPSTVVEPPPITAGQPLAAAEVRPRAASIQPVQREIYRPEISASEKPSPLRTDRTLRSESIENINYAISIN
uniref:Uncharacterized protein n=1 Tax=Anopheles melas TaxID=34690 RepID=A0A182U333_9DIPT